MLSDDCRVWSPTGIVRGTRTSAPSGATSRPPISCCTTVPPTAKGRGAMAGSNAKPPRQDLQARTKRFALDTIRLCAGMPQSPECRVITQQLIRAACSVGANYRAACRAQSRAAFIAKLSIVEEEADETLYWMGLLEELIGEVHHELSRLKEEAGELTAMTVASKKTARANASRSAVTRHLTLDPRHLS